MEELIRQGYIYFGRNNRVVFSTAQYPGREVPSLPPTGRYQALLEILSIT
jgi:hypothetical protein